MDPRPPLPEGWEVPIRRTSCRPSQIILGVPMEILGIALWLSAELALVFGAWPQAIALFLLIWTPARALTRRDPWWLEIARQRMASGLVRLQQNLRTRPTLNASR
ncbi:MAG: hypothetical protein RLY86_3751 [Pseudomonadota bacterium]|jgi:type IV secretory pathway TrbD component